MMQSPALTTFASGIRGIVTCPEDVLGHLTLRQIAILFAVASARGFTVRGLAAELNLEKPVISRACDTLGRLGLTRRTRDPRDRRSVFINITDTGREVVAGLGRILQ